MKKIFLTAAFLFSGIVFSQSVEPEYEIVNGMVKATYFYENGQVRQTGMYKNGKPHGNWESYNENGTKQSLGAYDKGNKVGKWFFWNNTNLAEVDYNKNSVLEVKKWSKELIADRN